MQTSAMKVYFLIAECRLSYAKIDIMFHKQETISTKMYFLVQF